MVVIVLLAFGLRAYRLGADSLWYDETVSVHLANESIPALVGHTARDIHPPGYYLLLHGWSRLAGSSEFSAAFFSLSFGVLLVILAYRLAVRAFGPGVGLLAALLVAISPYNLWYSQEVRMYTLGAALGLLLLGVVLSLLDAPGGTLPPWRWLGLYALCGALGLWTLYYFAFLLVAVNLMVVIWWLVCRQRGRVGWSWLGRWLLAQGAILLLYAPWIPVAWRQAIEPPVPPWRGFAPLGEVLVETWSALSLGQSVAPQRVWPVLLLFAVIFILGLFCQVFRNRQGGGVLQMAQSSPGRRRSTARSPQAGGIAIAPWLFAGYVLIPAFLIYLASFIAPLYHVRYVFTYSPPFYIVLAAGLVCLGQRWRLVMGLALAAILLSSAVSIHAYHSDPRYAGDDHRGATQFLAERWRPGDAILVNAGYGYTALMTYWDGEPIAWRGRLVDYAGDAGARGPVVLQTGTVDGDPALGWGHPESDFYAMDRAETEAALEGLFLDVERLWVYRIYDTVTDPGGLIRDWLDEHGTQFEDRVFTGESQLRVQGFLTGRDPLLALDPLPETAVVDGSLQLAAASYQSQVEAGGALDTVLAWRVVSPPSENALLFAGLFDQDGRRWAQADEQPLGPLHLPSEWPAGAVVRTPLRVLVPPGTPPGRYRLDVGWYRFVEGQPVWLPWATGERLTLGEVQVEAPSDWWALPLPSMAQPVGVTMGEGVQLMGFDAPVLEGHPGEPLPLDLFWRALQDAPEAGLAVVQLVDDAGNLWAETASAPVDGRVPFAQLAAGQAIRDPRLFTLPGELPPGVYNLRLGRQRLDGSWTPVRHGPFSLGSTVPLATVHVRERSLNLAPPAVQHPASVQFGSGIRFIGHDLYPPSSPLQTAPSRLQLTLYWQSLAPMTTPYKIFVHLVGPDGQAEIRSQADVYPQRSTAGWALDEYLSDQVLLDLPGDLPPGRYDLLLGWYDESTGARLPASDAVGQPLGDALLLEQFQVGE